MYLLPILELVQKTGTQTARLNSGVIFWKSLHCVCLNKLGKKNRGDSRLCALFQSAITFKIGIKIKKRLFPSSTSNCKYNPLNVDFFLFLPDIYSFFSNIIRLK